MPNSEESLRFYNWAELEQTPSRSPPRVHSSLGANNASTNSFGESPPTQSLTSPLAPVPSIHVHTEWHETDVNPSFYPPPIFNVPELLAKPPILSLERSDPDTIHTLSRILAEIEVGLCPNSSCVDSLVAHRKNTFACPFARCLKKHGGWSCIRHVRDHIWIDHLFRRIPCTWDNCEITFSRDQERDTHIKSIHLRNGGIFKCVTWYLNCFQDALIVRLKPPPVMKNSPRSLISIVTLRIYTNIRQLQSDAQPIGPGMQLPRPFYCSVDPVLSLRWEDDALLQIDPVAGLYLQKYTNLPFETFGGFDHLH